MFYLEWDGVNEAVLFDFDGEWILKGDCLRTMTSVEDWLDSEGYRPGWWVFIDGVLSMHCIDAWSAAS